MTIFYKYFYSIIVHKLFSKNIMSTIAFHFILFFFLKVSFDKYNLPQELEKYFHSHTYTHITIKLQDTFAMVVEYMSHRERESIK